KLPKNQTGVPIGPRADWAIGSSVTAKISSCDCQKTRTGDSFGNCQLAVAKTTRFPSCPENWPHRNCAPAGLTTETAEVTKGWARTLNRRISNGQAVSPLQRTASSG